MKVDIQIEGDSTKILINDLPHLFISDRLIGYQTFIHEERWFKIEFYTKHKNILVEYDSKDKWLTILQELNKLPK